MISLTLRQHVLRRDKFTCQLCGAKPPDVRIEVDHKTPRSKGGSDTEANLWTTCIACNRGKGNRWDDGSPMCEACGKERAMSFSFSINEEWNDSVCHLTCLCTSDTEHYYLTFDLFRRERDDCIRHISKKMWFNAREFYGALHRFEQAA